MKKSLVNLLAVSIITSCSGTKQIAIDISDNFRSRYCIRTVIGLFNMIIREVVNIRDWCKPKMDYML